MAKTKISEFDLTPANNTEIDGINIAEGCAPSGINNAIRELMSQLKAQQDGSSGDTFTLTGTLTAATVVASGTVTSSGTLAVTGNLTLDGASGTSGQSLISAGSGATPTWGTPFISGMIMMWSGSIASIPSGWVLCNGSNSTPDLRDRFVVGAGSTYAVGATGGSANATLVSHTHTASVYDPGHAHVMTAQNQAASDSHLNDAAVASSFSGVFNATPTSQTNITSIQVTNSTEGSSATNANLPPYYALAYIMKT
jgi:microcystin-dependent protein